MSATACTTFPAVSLLSFSSTANATRVRRSFPCSNLYTAYLDSNSNLKLPRLRISQKRRIVRNHVFRLSKVCCLDGNHFEELSESASPSDTNDLKAEATVDLKLPRRSLLVHFTCNACGERTQKLINRLAYERGTVFVQCAGCSLHHKLIDNLGLVVEYDFREEQVMDTNADEI